jgi:secreted trypsin-like serine protease
MKMKIVVAITLLCFSELNAQPIIGGTNATPSEFSYIAGLVDKSTSSLYDGAFCGASHIGNDWILTAAHCLYDDNGGKLTINDLDVYLNVWKLSAPPSNYERLSVKAIFVHPNYNDVTTDNDIALIQLNKSSAFPIIKLPKIGQDSLYNAGNNAIIAGWGIYDVKNSLSADVLRRANIDIISTTICNGVNSYDGDISSNMFCAGKPDGSKDACQGDSGGPLLVANNGDTTQIGIVSWGDDCGVADFPGVYTRVINYINWINTITNGVVSTPQMELQQKVKWQLNQQELELISADKRPIHYAVYNATGTQLAAGTFITAASIDVENIAAGMLIVKMWNDQTAIQIKCVKP